MSALLMPGQTIEETSQPAEPSSRRFLPWLIAAGLVVLTLAAYWPTFSNGFVNYDDPGYVVQNHIVQTGLNFSSFIWAWRATIMANWHPLTWISHMADVQFFRLNAGGHHASSLILHLLNVVLLFFLLYKSTSYIWRSALIAAIFAVHPLNVECVAWISERKSLLYTMFLFLTLFAYGWYSRKPGVARYLLVALLFALGLASKPMIITLPFALLLLDYWPLERLPAPDSTETRPIFWRRFLRLALEKLPLLLLCLGSAYITVVAQAQTNTIAGSDTLSVPIRIGNAVYSYGLYIAKALWPVHLAIFYPHPERSLGIWKPMLALAPLALFTAYCLGHLRQRYMIAGWLWYLGTLVPVIGLVQVGRQAMADRYAYTPLLGVLVIVVWWLAENSAKLQLRAETLGILAGLALLFFGVLTHRQTGYWKNSFTLFEHAISVVPSNFIAENNLAEAYMQTGRQDLALPHAVRATQLRPRFGLAHYNVGTMLAAEHRGDEARREFELAIRYGQEKPEIASAYHNLGIVLLDEKRLSEAAAMFSEALRMDPNRQNTYLARGSAEFQMSDFRGAERDFLVAVGFSPDPSGYFWLGRSKEKLGDLAGAVEAYRKTLSIQPAHGEAKTRLDALVSGQPLPFLSLDKD
jgi:protein O-mannosyl-transferase